MKTTSQTPDCYDCQYRRPIIGDAHSKCVHPKAVPHELVDNALVELLVMLGGMPPMPSDLNVQGNPHGIRKGWFSWPFNFDPVWLISCDGFHGKQDPT